MDLTTREKASILYKGPSFYFYSLGTPPPFPMWDTGALQSTPHKAARLRAVACLLASSPTCTERHQGPTLGTPESRLWYHL